MRLPPDAPAVHAARQVARSRPPRAGAAAFRARRPRLSVASRRTLTTMTVLHVQKVAGISGSEAHLLQLLPALVQRGWDIRFLMLHEQEPGRVGVRPGARGGRRAGGRDRDEDRRRSEHVRAGALLPREPPADDPPHAPRPRRRVRPDGRDARRGADPALDEARLQRVPRGADLRARRPDDRRARPPADRDLARPRPLPVRDGGLPRAGLRDRPLRDRGRARAEAVRRRGAALPLHRAPDPDQGTCRAAPRVPAGARRAARRDARHRRAAACSSTGSRICRASSG